MEGTNGWDSPAWSRWPESGPTAEAGWTPQSTHTRVAGSVISLSPHGSINGSRRGSLAKSKMSEGSRRGSDPSLLGFALAQRRRSSARSSNSGRRRSSAFSVNSLDPMDALRVRNVASMDMLGRRFSEVVEVTIASDDGEDDTSMARRMMSRWSPYSSSTDYTDSEVHTAPYMPTPQLRPDINGLPSNFPLASVPSTQTPDNRSDISDYDLHSNSPSPIPRRVLPPLSMSRSFSTPSPPPAPMDILRRRARPPFPRAATTTEYQFPLRSAGVPIGASMPVVRPALGRSVSTPLFASNIRAQKAVAVLETRAAGSFPIARQVPIGRSRLRESLRRQSIVSDGGDSRRGSLLTDRRMSALRDSIEIPRRNSADSRRASPADGSRRQSATQDGPRRQSVNQDGSRRQSVTQSGRRSSNASLSLRKASVVSLTLRKQSTTSSNEGRRASLTSRKSSVVSIGEYGYLGPQIVIDQAQPESARHETTRPVRDPLFARERAHARQSPPQGPPGTVAPADRVADVVAVRHRHAALQPDRFVLRARPPDAQSGRDDPTGFSLEQAAPRLPAGRDEPWSTDLAA